MHQALREVLGTHVEQKGSLVNSKYLRFDFSHFSKMTDEEISKVENFVNARIHENLDLEEQRQMAYEDALAEGAIALFGEKYDDAVRTIKFGKSMELCGGTHVGNTSKIWHFIITTETSVASGIRRIEAITGEAALKHLEKSASTLDEIKLMLNQPQDVLKSVEAIQNENADLKKQLERLKKDKIKQLKSEITSKIQNVDGVNFVSQKVDLDANAMKDLAFQLGGEIENLFIVLGAEQDGKALLNCYISKNLVEEKSLNAGKIIKDLGKHIQGGGGGQAFFATAGGKNPSGITKALEAAKNVLV